MAIGEQVTGVFETMTGWFTGSLADVANVFYQAETGLTFIGWMTLGALAIGVTTMLLAWVRSIVKFK